MTESAEDFTMITTVTENLCTEPIRTVDSFLTFNSSQVNPRLKSLPKWTRKDSCGPLLLLCHDMCGGYKDDRFVDGTDNPKYFNFYNWAQIDVFCYFSHCFITIPPIMWIESSHRNGVPVLGTFITEWDEGARKCAQIFESPQTAIIAAQILTDIAKCYCFDGWLINIENKLDLNEVTNVHVFLKELSKIMRSANPNSSVIWYDSVTINGDLEWQNSITDLNTEYFNCCDGIFLNYTWNDWQLNLTTELCGTRSKDVFVGIDVWSRNCVGGMESHQSCEKIKDFGMSIALFAPGWVYETSHSDMSFEKKNSLYWRSLLKTCPPKPLKTTSIKTYFKTGAGYKEFYQGAQTGDEPKFNMCDQDIPYVRTGLNIDGCDVKFTKQSAYNGGSCVRICSNLNKVFIKYLIGVNIEVGDCEICLGLSLKPESRKEVQPLKEGLEKLFRFLTLSGEDGEVKRIVPYKSVTINSWAKFYFKYKALLPLKWVGFRVCKPEGYDLLVGKLSLKGVKEDVGEGGEVKGMELYALMRK